MCFSRLNCFALCPNFKETKRLAAINGDFHVLVYNFETGEIVRAHKGHYDEMNKPNQFTAITFTTSNVVISSFHSDLIKFCLLSNSFKTYPDFASRNSVTIMKTSPKDPNLIAAGTKNGLILLIDSDKMEIKVRIRGQDMEITSLDFMIFPIQPKENFVQQQLKKKKILEAKTTSNTSSTAANADDDIFDLYTYEKVENEFGVYQDASEEKSDYEESNVAAFQEKVHATSDFNFLEACTNLKDQIMCKDTSNVCDANGSKYEDNKEQYGVKNDENPSVDLSIESNPSSHTPVLTEESINYLEECQRMKDFAVTSKQQPEENELLVLASGSRECVVYLWDVIEHTALHKIRWHPKEKKSHLLPAPFTNVLWMNAETLLITDNNGDINEYKIKFDAKKRSISDQRQKKTFDVKGALNICKSADSSVLWVSSIHRHICCFETQTYSKIISIDTLQIRIHYIEENPIDSHVIAIAGNDKRLCLWNTSEANHHCISLKPFMNKIHSCILCCSWHPDKDNILAFSTREGRIGVLDTNKFSNVPVILESFTTHEIYSMKWAKYTDANGSDVIVLIACSSGKLVFYTYKDFKVHLLNQFKQVCAVAPKGNLLAIGNGTGTVIICDMSKEFQILTQVKVCRKYIGMMTWHNEDLAISSETGITFIRGINETTQLSEESLIKIAQQKRIYSVRFNKSGDRIVTASMSGNVTVWDVQSLTPIASVNIESPAYSAIFMPNNEQIIICGGQDSTIHCFEWEKYPVSDGEVVEKTLKFEDKTKDIEWGIFSEMTTMTKNKKKRVKKRIQPKEKNGDVSEIVNSIGKIQINSKKLSTVFNAANREIIGNPLNYIEMLLSEKSERKPSLNERMFGSRDDIKIMIEKECELIFKIYIFN